MNLKRNFEPEPGRTTRASQNGPEYAFFVVQAVSEEKNVFSMSKTHVYGEQKHVGVVYRAPNLMSEGVSEAKFRAGTRENDESLPERP